MPSYVENSLHIINLLYFGQLKDDLRKDFYQYASQFKAIHSCKILGQFQTMFFISQLAECPLLTSYKASNTFSVKPAFFLMIGSKSSGKFFGKKKQQISKDQHPTKNWEKHAIIYFISFWSYTKENVSIWNVTQKTIKFTSYIKLNPATEKRLQNTLE